MKLIKIVLMSFSLLINYDVFGMRRDGEVTNNEIVLWNAIQNNDEIAFKNILFTSLNKIPNNILWSSMIMDTYPSFTPEIELNALFDHGFTSFLHEAVSQRRLSMIKILLQKGAQVNCSQGRSAIHYCSDEEVFKILLLHGSDINIKDHNHDTALHLNIHRWRSANSQLYNTNAIKMIKMLLYHNADVTLKDAGYKTPLDLINATQNKPIQIVQIMQNTIQEIIAYKNEVLTNNTVNALDKAITNNGANNSQFTKKEWLTLALYNNHRKQIEYCITNKIFEPEYILALLLLNKQLPVDIVSALTLMVKKETAYKLYKKAKEENHKKLGQKNIAINNIVSALALKNTGNSKGRLPSEVVSIIISFL